MSPYQLLLLPRVVTLMTTFDYLMTLRLLMSVLQTSIPNEAPAPQGEVLAFKP